MSDQGREAEFWEALQEADAKWQQDVLNPLLERFGERRERFERSDGNEVEAVYGPQHTRHQDFLRDLGFPGSYPYTRGVQPTMYRGRLWTMRQYAGFGDAAQSNERYRYLLSQGTTGLSVAFDLPTQMGYDSDSARARGEVGKVGVAIDSIADMEVLLDQLPLDKISTSMTINATASTLLALYVAVADARGIDRGKLRGTIQNDVLKEYIARGTYIYPPRPSMRIITDIFGFCQAEVPRWNTVSISGYHIREAGSTAVQEVGFTLANGIAYVEAALAAGLDVDEFAGRLSFFFNVHNNFIEEVAKFRAARRLWARIMKERFGAKDERSMRLRFHSQTAGSTLTAQQPQVNIVRVAMQALASVMGGTQSLHTNSWDEALGLPTEASALMALRTQQVIAHETGVADMVDPLAGSYAVEALTDAIEEGARDYIERYDELGGAVQAIEAGFPQSEIQEAAYQAQLAQERGEQVIVGVNRYKAEQEAPVAIHAIDPEVERSQVARLRELKASRAASEVERARQALAQAARGGENLMPHIVEAVVHKVTLGEVADTLREVFGEYVENVVF
ncbi:methylmalonyl-CoA mutase [Lujinxingia litoralis]|uniref:Methylmalonyl-CoA mutase n=1 Tax=Lujinxingia litoralis TaxID=2211119 RepID=A0A328C4A6_9DELT|nr:methylmalonyl-CoA mutase family protein [Lujinxingia litoralis]RAL22151.1 methylmalonyl-CoA mutase [Lujinxingia litoralis]